MHNFICSDPDCAQYYRKVNDFVYIFIEARGFPDGGYVVCETAVDVRWYSLDELWAYCSGYYDSFEDMIAAYGFREAIHIVAECVFEQLNFDDMEFAIEQDSMEEAIKFIHEWAKRDGMLDIR